ncbi:hypothetical protein F5144DRAFT_485176 [Chaetomium tenue]|uniref:Uncharacterized protein n=1 Tax=Chaetomium tenue TaxID=1854479 RepID=A0ACB7PF70_9PEZI|nr:hypothetical protein F5144DRAFT_485176 [Chaetomium globosum]
MDLGKTAPAHQEYDLLIVTDATSSMGSFLVSLKSSLNDIIRISATTASFSRIGVLGYRDYDQTMSQVTEWSGWHSRDAQSEVSQAELLAFVDKLKPQAGGDWPEAARTGLALAHQVMRPEAKTIVLLYADAPPHTERRAGLWKTEQDKLCEPGAYGGNGKLFADWTSVCRTLGEGEKRAQVFSIVEEGGSHTDEIAAMFLYLSACTGGVCLGLPKGAAVATISEVTINLLLAWMGADKQGAKLDSRNIATHFHYRDKGKVNQLTSEKDGASVRYLSISSTKTDKNALEANIVRPKVSLETMSQIIPSREHPAMDFAKRYKADPEYQKIVVEQLTEIIESDVSALSVNPVFGALWRTVCNDRLNPARDGLITSFGLQVDRTTDANKKERLKKWLEESYDFAGEIVEMIEAVPEEARYPCVFLDPTVRFTPAENEEDDEANATGFTRDELLEIGRSCDYRILRRLGRILTRLTYVNSKGDLPAHVKDVPETEVPKIPMALARSEHQCKFWKVLLHTVLPGTMLAARPAALLAALSVRLGIKPLEEVAYTELLAWRDNWNTLDIPETWSVNCLSLLLEADKKLRQATAGTQSAEAGRQTVLKEEDRRLFGALVDYKMLEMNLSTTFEAEVGWSPNKSKAPLGPVVMCNACEFPRSVTIMGADGTCGVCLGTRQPGNDEPREVQEARVTGGVSKSDNSDTTASWNECSMTDCRAQYVVYNPKLLNVRPKCHYCRQINRTSQTNPNYKALTIAPCVTCTKCTNRVIWPAVYRPSSFDESTYQCPACTAGTISTIVTVETTASALASENGTAWLLRNDDATIPDPLNNRSLYHTITHITDPTNLTTLFPSKVSILPTSNTPLTLTHHHKPIHNTPALLTTLTSWITRRRTQSGTCTLCFSNFPKRHLHPACGGRRGCAERICTSCATAWYGANRPGRVLNTAALACPFCRRRPAPTAAALPRAVRCLGGVREAVEERGEWVYAWCAGACGRARRFVERVCARGVPEVGEGWRCEECVAAKGGLVVKTCPACGVATERTAGCDHISCPCGKHWCFNCAAMVADTAAEVYAHMSDVHHTWFEGGGGADYAAYEFESDEEEEDDDDDLSDGGESE